MITKHLAEADMEAMITMAPAPILDKPALTKHNKLTATALKEEEIMLLVADGIKIKKEEYFLYIQHVVNLFIFISF